MLPLYCGAKRLAKARVRSFWSSRGLGEDQALRLVEAERVHVGDEDQQPARLWPPLTMPNSAACLIELIVSPPALARPMICALEDWAWSRNDEKSWR